MKTRTEIEVRRINHPKTVCSNANCVKIWTINNATTTEYIQECHSPCGLKDVQEDSIGHVGLMGCWAMQNGVCRHLNCRHSYREHLHVYYDSVQVPRQVVDSAVTESLKNQLTATEMKQQMISARNKEVEEYENELKQIEEASVRFAYFLKSNAITPYNDAIEQYLEHLIGEEEVKVTRGGTRAALANLRQSLNSYKTQKLILEQEMVKGVINGGDHPPGPADVERLVNHLQTLKYSGRALKDALDCVEHAKAVEYQEAVVKPPRNRGRHGRQNNNNFGSVKAIKDVGSGIVKSIRNLFGYK